MMASGVSGDYGKLWATIAGLKSLSKIPSKVAAAAAPKLAQQARNDATLERNPYGRAFAPHAPATTKRWGAHGVLQLSGKGIGSIDVTPSAGAGLTLTAADHMAFSQYGTPTEPIRNVFPNNPTLPKGWTRILERCAEQQLKKALK